MTGRQIRYVVRLARIAVISAVVFLGALLTAGGLGIGGIHTYAVLSGSMAPAIPAGALIVVRPAASVAPGDVATFATGDARRPVTHRVVARTDDGLLITRGDANQADDPLPRHPSRVIGTVVAHVPYLGRVVAAAQTVPGFILLVVIPGTLLVYHELLTLTGRIERLLRKQGDIPHA